VAAKMTLTDYVDSTGCTPALSVTYNAAAAAVAACGAI